MRRASIQEKDQEPRYEISKIKALAEVDLELTRQENHKIEESIYGNGVILGHDIDQQIRNEINEQDQSRFDSKQLLSSRKNVRSYLGEKHKASIFNATNVQTQLEEKQR